MVNRVLKEIFLITRNEKQQEQQEKNKKEHAKKDMQDDTLIADTTVSVIKMIL